MLGTQPHSARVLCFGSVLLLHPTRCGHPHPNDLRTWYGGEPVVLVRRGKAHPSEARFLGVPIYYRAFSFCDRHLGRRTGCVFGSRALEPGGPIRIHFCSTLGGGPCPSPRRVATLFEIRGFEHRACSCCCFSSEGLIRKILCCRYGASFGWRLLHLWRRTLPERLP